MAKLESTVKISVEKLLVDGLKSFANQFAKDNKLLIKDISIDWTYIAAVGVDTEATVDRVNVSLESL